MNINMITETLEKQEYTTILVCIINGKNYASTIARILSKTQPTITSQLKTMEKLDIIKPEKRKKAKVYKVNWVTICEYFYHTIEGYIELRKDNRNFPVKGIKSLTNKRIRKAVPKKLIENFLEFYSKEVIEILLGKYKTFDELVVSLFGAIFDLDKKDISILINSLDIDEKAFQIIIDIVSFETISVEKAAILEYLKVIHKNDKN